MNKEKNSTIIIILLSIIIIIISVLCVLFATNTITLNNKQNVEKTTTNNESTEFNNFNSTKEERLQLNLNIYSSVIEEYKKAFNDEDISWDSNYKYINFNKIIHKKFDIEYTFYDINKDGTDEMIINGIIDIFSYDGTNIIRLFKDNADCLAETRCSIKLYDDGTIYFSGSGGASSQYISFYNINKNISTLNTINSYYLKYGDNRELTIYDEKNYDIINDKGTKLNYTSIEELEKINIKNANIIDLNKLEWTQIQ